MTYGFSLYRLGRSAEGIEIIKKLPAAGLHDPHAAVYAAILFLDENQVAAAREFTAAAQAGPIFAEEKKLLDKAMAKAEAAAPGPSATASPVSSPPASSTP